ncbi:MAG: ATP-binding protein [Minwuia sp.]|uniref:PAS domain-containing sensor histidine kinase n=1 Tax=Minwuia sp. TaxID=2493630 RepID=UPI003A867DFF
MAPKLALRIAQPLENSDDGAPLRPPADDVQRFQDFAEAASEWFWEMDAELRFCWFSERFEQIAGVPPHYLLGKSRRELITSGDPVTDEIVSLEDWWNHVADLEAHRAFKSFIHPRVHPDGHKVYLSISGKPIHDEAGRFLGYRGIGADITERIEIERTLREAKTQAEAANRAKSEFLATMSHELRTPLNAIIGFSDMIQNELAGPVGQDCYRDYAGDINSSGRRLLAVINDVLDMARTEADMMPIDADWYPVHELLDDVRRKMARMAEEAGIGIEIHNGPDGLEVLADRRRTGQILANLVSNAIKFSERGQQVCLTWKRYGTGKLLVQVQDRGIGMTAEEVRLAFQPFVQIGDHKTRQAEGTGLGLPLSRRLCEIQGMTLSLDSRPAEGATATVSFPQDRFRHAED